MKRLIWLALWGCLCWSQTPGSLASVVLRVVDPFGEMLPYEIESFKRSDGVELASHFKGLVGSEVPFGYYHYVVFRAKGVSGLKLDTREGYASVHAAEFLKTVVAPSTPLADPSVSMEDGRARQYYRTGSVSPLPGPGSNLWIRFMPVFGDDFYETQVHQDGTFRLYYALDGTYVAIVTAQEGNKVVCSQVLRIELEKSGPPKPLSLVSCR
jgi:hypothetical protein